MSLKRIIVLISLCCSSFWSFGQTWQPVQLKQDFDVLSQALEEAHGGLYRYHSTTAIDKMFRQQRSMLKLPMDRQAFYARLSTLLAYIGDGHMKIDMDATNLKPLFFPFQIINSRRRTFILTNDTPDDNTIRPGMELLSINGTPVRQLRKKIMSCLIGDGSIETGKQAALQSSFSQNYWLFVDTTAVFHVRVQDANGKIYKATVKGLKNAQRVTYRNQNPVNTETRSRIQLVSGSAENISLKNSANRTLTLRVHSFAGEGFQQQLDSVMNIIVSTKPRALVLDLRGNGGGMDELGAYLATKFTNKPFHYIDHIHTRVLIPAFADWKAAPPVDLVDGLKPDPSGGYLVQRILNSTLTTQQPAANPYLGKLIILIDGKTFSAASDFCAVISNLTHPIFVGEETGGGYEGNTSALNAILKLPNSGFKINIHLWDYWSAVKKPKHPGRGTLPQYAVSQNPEHWLSGIDDQYEFALRLCK